ncbi:MAG: hypothetical protein LBN04_12250 [Oscillospiraceae bacterium]|jgi:nitroreductase|nr:hypothetical protein [Oscillospiraceae bacterium]
MELYQAIARRQSTRRYAPDPLPEAFLSEMEAAIAGFAPLYPDRPIAHRLARQVRGMLSVSAPHYLILSGQGAPGEKEQAGFLYEQLVLWLDTQGIGSVWLGGTRDKNANPAGQDLLTIAFGRAQGAVHREASAFKRKPIAEITNAPDDPCIQAAHLAPSAINMQPWYFQKDPGGVSVYRRGLRPPLSLVYTFGELDMGIALAHYAVAAKQFGRGFAFTRGAEGCAAKAGYEAFGRITNDHLVEGTV